MGAHLREMYVRHCSCGKPAKVELFNTFNAPLGSFCKPCGKRALAETLKREQVDWDRGVRNNGLVSAASPTP
jgi:hypothetical protein